MIFLFNRVIFRFRVNFPGCLPRFLQSMKWTEKGQGRQGR